MRVIRSLQRHNNIPLLPPLTEVYKQFPFMYNQSVASGPSLVSDIYGLPLVRPGCRVPTWIKRRRRNLKKLSPAACNTLLTGDPFFAFDNTAYDSEWTIPAYGPHRCSRRPRATGPGPNSYSGGCCLTSGPSCSPHSVSPLLPPPLLSFSPSVRPGPHPSFSHHNHHEILNPVGKIAAKMSYIHVAKCY
jgi:hypothetical protein